MIEALIPHLPYFIAIGATILSGLALGVAWLTLLFRFADKKVIVSIKETQDGDFKKHQKQFNDIKEKLDEIEKDEIESIWYWSNPKANSDEIGILVYRRILELKSLIASRNRRLGHVKGHPESKLPEREEYAEYLKLEGELFHLQEELFAAERWALIGEDFETLEDFGAAVLNRHRNSYNKNEKREKTDSDS